MNNETRNNQEQNTEETSRQETSDINNIFSTENDVRWFFKTQNVIYYVLGVIEVLLAFRLIFKLLGANANNIVVYSLYSLTNALIAPFAGIFNVITPGGATGYVLEPNTIIAMITYAIIVYGLVKLLRVTVLDNV